MIKYSISFFATLSLFSCCFFFHCCYHVARALAEEPDITYPTLYQWGKESYTKERWYECVAFMKRALEDYDYFQSTVLHCQKRCKRLVFQDPFLLSDEQVFEKKVDEVRMFERIVHNSMCLKRCVEDRIGKRPSVPTIQKIDDEFEQLLPYSYMQFCYWKLGDLEHAVSAAYTYYVRNPNDTMMTENLKFYMSQSGFSTKMNKNLREHDHEDFYEKGLEFYESEDFDNAASTFELTLEKYLKLFKNCRLTCVHVNANVNANDRGPFRDIYSIFTSYIREVLICRTKCLHKLTTIKSQQEPNFVPLVLNYLQFSYWKTNKLRKAAEAVATYLEYLPNDQTMMDNKNFYATNIQTTEDLFIPRKDLILHKQQYVLDLKLLDQIEKKMKYDKEEYPAEHPDDYKELDSQIDQNFETSLANFQKLILFSDAVKPEDNIKIDAKNDQKDGSDDDDRDTESELEGRVKRNGYPTTALSETCYYGPGDKHALDWFRDKYGISVTKKEKDLNGTCRFFAKNLLTRAECDELLKLKDLAQMGSGYEGKGSPHTKHETFFGFTLENLLQHSTERSIPLNLTKLFFDKSELARRLTEKYFNLSSHLYVDYTHLACRSANPGSSRFRYDLSHPIHGDNCVFKNGRCDKSFPAFTWRDFSALIYLNDDFDGGEFIFSDKNQNEAASLKPSCGQMIGFIGHTLHGVKAVTKGTRCALALWMTLDPQHQEKARNKVQEFLSMHATPYSVISQLF